MWIRKWCIMWTPKGWRDEQIELKREPIKVIDGKEYFRDDLKGEYRCLTDPDDVIVFDVWVYTGPEFTEEGI